MAVEAPALPGQAARWMILGEWRAHPARVALAAVAIAVGVALGLAVHLVNASALAEFSRAVAAVNGEAELQVRSATPAGFDESLYPVLARTPGVAAASPVVELEARAGAERLTLLGLDIFRAAAVTPSLIGRPAAEGARGPTDEAFIDEDALFLSNAALDRLGVRPGERVTLRAAGHEADFRVAGSLPGAEEGRLLAVADIATVQWRFGQLGRLQRLDLKPRQGVAETRLRAAVAERLPAEAQLVDAESEGRRSDAMSRAYRVNLNMLALMALLTGGFLVYSAQQLSVARRRAQFALLRVLGARRRDLIAQVLGEGIVVGIVGGLAGLSLGVGLASAALRILGGDLGGGYFEGARPELAFAPRAAIVFFGLGLAAAAFGSMLPAREAARARPAVALKNAGEALDPRRRPSPGPAVGLLLAGAVAALAPAIGGVPVLGYAAMALLLAGGVAGMPWLARVLLAPVRSRTFRAPPVDLAFKRLWGAPSQAAVALCGMVASASLVVAMAVMVTSFRASVEDWLVQVLPADLYMRVETAASGGGFDPQTQAALAAAPGIAGAHFAKAVPLRIAPDRPPVALVVRPMGPGTPPMIPVGRMHEPRAGLTPVWISEPAARLYGWRAGQEIDLPVGRQGARVLVAGVWRDYARQHGAIAIASEDYTRLTGDPRRDEASFDLEPGTTAREGEAALRAALPPALADRIDVAEPRTLRAFALRLFDRSFAVTYGLEAIAMFVGLAGVAATISAQTLARAKEFGMLRHLGVSRRQIVAMLATEGALLGAVGVVAGIGLGLAMSQVLIHVVNPQSFHWTMQTHLPWRLLAGVAAGLVTAAAVTALLAGRRALSADAVRAVREDW
ncbi:MAG: FtsX-like permease family protein [Phenylobacterium sp.]|uniref:FtsX-like permease family protein n=1 Tax=Phenylobacterium sp. TaxID=1871053 RepID=UPI00391D9FF6